MAPMEVVNPVCCTIYCILQPDSGVIELRNQRGDVTLSEAFRQMAVVMQESTGDFDFSVREIVMMGRNPHKGMFGSRNCLGYSTG